MVVWVEGGEIGGREAGGGCLGPEEDLPWGAAKGKGEFHFPPRMFSYELPSVLIY